MDSKSEKSEVIEDDRSFVEWWNNWHPEHDSKANQESNQK